MDGWANDGWMNKQMNAFPSVNQCSEPISGMIYPLGTTILSCGKVLPQHFHWLLILWQALFLFLPPFSSSQDIYLLIVTRQPIF
jgi:hypothetical protein